MGTEQRIPPIVTLNDIKPGESWSTLLFGPSKAGKTFFAGTSGPRSLFINIGDGIETLKSPAFSLRYPKESGLIVVELQHLVASGAATVFDGVTRTIDAYLAHHSDKFDTIVLDEATALRRHALTKAMDLNTAARKEGTRKSRKNEYVKAEIGDYGIEMDMIEWFLGEYTPIFKAAKKNFLMLAHEREIYGKPQKIGDEAPLLRTVPGFTGKTFPSKVPAYFDDVWKIEAVGSVNVVHRIITEGNEKLLAGSRHGGVFNRLEPDPNYLSMLNRIKNQIPAKKNA